jgi:hypothetical protein
LHCKIRPEAKARGRAGKLDQSFPGFVPCHASHGRDLIPEIAKRFLGTGSSQIFPALKCAEQNPGLPRKAEQILGGFARTTPAGQIFLLKNLGLLDNIDIQ